MMTLIDLYWNVKLKGKTYLQETRKTVACEQHRDFGKKKNSLKENTKSRLQVNILHLSVSGMKYVVA